MDGSGPQRLKPRSFCELYGSAKAEPFQGTDLSRGFPQPLEPYASLVVDFSRTRLGGACGAQVSVQRTDANLGHRGESALAKLQGIEESFNVLSVVPSAHIDYQQGVEPVSHNDNAVVIGCIPARDSANVSGGVSPKRESVFAKQLGIGA